jgi:rfaE bifunctional protein nucleotidyltransferase chain/domain
VAGIVSLRKLKMSLSTGNSQGSVLVGGCFDILHIGHVRFFSEAKKMGDYLVVLLESDSILRKLKGGRRPVFTQKERAGVLSALGCVDLIVKLSAMETDRSYLNLVRRIKPEVIAVTENDPLMEKKRRQAEEVGSELRVIHDSLKGTRDWLEKRKWFHHQFM